MAVTYDSMRDEELLQALCTSEDNHKLQVDYEVPYYMFCNTVNDAKLTSDYQHPLSALSLSSSQWSFEAH